MRMVVETKAPERARYRALSFVSSWYWPSVLAHLTIVAFPLMLLWRPLFAGQAFFWGTPLLQFVPWQELAADMWRSGHVPLWNPLVGCGAPLAANYQTAAFYPLNALYLLMEAEVALSWTVALHLALAGWGTYRWARTIGLDRFPALVGALALEGSGFLVGRAALFPSIAVTFPWIPIWLWRAEALAQSDRCGPESKGTALRSTLWLGLAMGLGLLAGHAQTACYGGLLVAAYATFRALQGPLNEEEGRVSEGREQGRPWSSPHRAIRTMFLFVLALVLGLGLAAVQLLPTAELLAHSQRSAGVGEGFAMTYSFWPWRLITLLAPSFFGNPGQGSYWGYGAHWEDALYVGLLPLLLAISAVIQAWSTADEGTSDRGAKRGGIHDERGPGRRMPSPAAPVADLRALTRFWTASVPVTLILALGRNTPVFPFLFRHVPGFDLFQAPTRWLAVTTVALSALAAIGAQQWPRGRRAERLGALGATVGAALVVGGAAAPRLVPNVPPTFGPATVRLGLGLIVVGILSLFRGRGRRTRGRTAAWWQAGAIAFVALDLLSFGCPLVPTVDRSLYQGKTETAAVLQREQDEVRVYWPSDPVHQGRAYDAQYRVKFDYLTFEDFGPRDPAFWRGMREDQLPNAGMLDGIASANNFDPLLVGRYADLLEAAVDNPAFLRTMGVTHVATDRTWSPGSRVHTASAASFYRLPDAPGRAWIVYEARHLPSGEILEALEDPAFDPGREVLLSGTSSPLPRSWSVSNTSRIRSLRDAPNGVRIQVALESPGHLVLADTWYPGWQVAVDGEPKRVLRANHAFRAVELDRGIHVVQMTYHPRSFMFGCWVSLGTFLIAVVGYLTSRRFRDRQVLFRGSPHSGS